MKASIDSSGNIKSDNLFLYGEETKESFVNEKTMKRKGFKEAMAQIESAMVGKDSCPVRERCLGTPCNRLVS